VKREYEQKESDGYGDKKEKLIIIDPDKGTGCSVAKNV
jgi:hypothetical protein